VLARHQIFWWLVWLAFSAAVKADTMDHMRTSRTEDYRITYWNSEQGLPQNTVNCLEQTRDGYLWIGTRYGLARYDGVQFTDYTSELISEDERELDVEELEEDVEGRLWLRTRGGVLYHWRGQFRRVALTNAPYPGPVRGLCASRSGGVWLGYKTGVVEYRPGELGRKLSLDRELRASISPQKLDLLELFEDNQGRLWTCFGDEVDRLWQRYDPATGRVETLMDIAGLPREFVSTLYSTPAGRLWWLQLGALYRWDEGKLEQWALPAEVTVGTAGPNSARTLAEDTSGNLWIASRGRPTQLHRFVNGQFTSYGRVGAMMKAEDVRCLFPDREGNIWVGSGGDGLYRMQPRQLVSVLAGSASEMDEVYSICNGQNGRVWLATTYGLLQYQAGKFTVFTNADGLIEDNTKRLRIAFEKSSGEVFACRDFDGLLALRDGVFVPVPSVEPPAGDRRVISGLSEDAAGKLWMTSPRGLVEQQGNSWRLWTTNDGLSDNQVSGMVWAPDGGLWVGTRTGGVNEFKQGRFRQFTTREGLLSQAAWPLKVEPDGTVWVGTPVGLNRIRSNQVASVTMREGLFDNLAYCLLEDRLGNYWTYGNRGIWRFKKDELHAVADKRASRVHCVSYGEADGMPSAEGNGDDQPNAAALPTGELWFPTTRGVVVMHPDRLRENKAPPRVVIEEVIVDQDRVYRDGGYAERWSSQVPSQGGLHLPPGRADVVEIRYTANTFVDSDKTHFRYRLLGEHQEWREGDTRRIAVFTNLRPGSYRFQVEACNHHGYWSEQPAEFAFSLAPHFYETWPFYGLCGLVLAAAFAGWHLRRLSNHRWIQQLEHERAMETERARIAKDLHDELGASLTGIALQIEVARREPGQPKVMEEHLRPVAESIRGVVDGMREVIWSLNPRCDTLESFGAYCCQFAETFLRSAGLRCRLDLPEELPSLALTAEARHHLVLSVKEALNNAAKHAAATEVRLGLHLTRNNSELVVTIQDNGRGFRQEKPRNNEAGRMAKPADSRASGHGLENIRRRIETLGGSFEVASELALGTRLTLTVPLDRRNLHASDFGN
jgi:signal transduction histidine kinase/ligand-binding sensor domain-containing protein